MGLFGKIFGRRAPRNVEEIRPEAEQLLRDVANMTGPDPKGAARRLAKSAGSDLETLFDFGAPMHEEFTRVALAQVNALRRLAGMPEMEAGQLPSVATVDDAEAPTAADVLAVARSAQADVVYARCLSRWDNWLDALLALEARCLMAAEEGVEAVFLGEEYPMVRREKMVRLLQEVDGALPFHKAVRAMGEAMEADEALSLENTRTAHGYEVFYYQRKA